MPRSLPVNYHDTSQASPVLACNKRANGFEAQGKRPSKVQKNPDCRRRSEVCEPLVRLKSLPTKMYADAIAKARSIFRKTGERLTKTRVPASPPRTISSQANSPWGMPPPAAASRPWRAFSRRCELIRKVEGETDLARDILKSETCALECPELSLSVNPGILGGRARYCLRSLVDDVGRGLRRERLEILEKPRGQPARARANPSPGDAPSNAKHAFFRRRGVPHFLPCGS